MYTVNKRETFHPAFRQGHRRSRMHLIFCLLTTALLCLTAASNTASAATYYLDAVNGNDSNPGTSAQPWKTIGKAFNTATYGDSVILRGGNYGDFYYTGNNDFPTYTGSMTEPLPADTQFITFKADVGHEPVFTRILLGNAYNTYYVPYIFERIRVEPDVAGQSGVTFFRCVGPRLKNLTIIGKTPHELSWGIYIRRAGSYYNNDMRIENCTIRSFWKGIDSTCYNVVITGNDIYDIGEDHLLVYLDNITIENNHIHHTNRPGVGEHPDGIAVAGVTNVVIRNNILHDLATQAIFIHGTAWTSNVLIENNLIYDTKVTEIQFGTADHVTIRNNTVIGAGLVQGVLIRGGTDHQVYNNIFVCGYGAYAGTLDYHDHNIYIKLSGTPGDEESNSYGYDWLGDWESTHNDAIEPELFANPDNYDFRLKAGCRAVDFGTSVGAPTTDILGNPRIGRPDAGCYEYQDLNPDTTAPSVPQNLTATPVSESQIDLSWQDSADPESGISLYKIYRDGNFVATSVPTSYSNTGLNSGTPYSYEVSAVNGQGLESGRSNTAPATTFSDTTPPSIVSVGASETSLEIVFNEPLETMPAEDVNNYSITTGGISVIAASLDTDTVTLTTSVHTEGTYTLTVENVQDTSGNPMTETTTDYQYAYGLVAYWKFNDGNGISALDSSGYGNTATLINGPVWTVQGELSFDGIDDAVEIPTANWDASNGTIALWAKAADLSGTRYLFGHTVGSWSNRIQLYADEGSLCLGLGDSHSTSLNIENLALQTWYHIALTWDGTDYVMYVDGIAKASGPYTGLTALNTFADIGNTGNASFRDEVFNGIIDEVRVYNRAVTADEVSNLALVFLPIDDKEVEEGSTLTFEVRTKDPNQEVLIESHNLPSDPNFFSNIFTWTPTYGDAGSYEVTFEAPHGEFVDFETITITVHKPTKPVYRFWSPINSRHFYTIKEAEKDKLINIYAHVWTYEDIVYYAFAEDSEPGLVPVYRFWSPVLEAHFYTIGETEKNKLINDYSDDVWTYEGVVFYAYAEGQQPQDAKPVYRFWSGTLGTHFYTIDETEANKLIDDYPLIWAYEGVAWHAYYE